MEGKIPVGLRRAICGLGAVWSEKLLKKTKQQQQKPKKKKQKKAVLSEG